MPKKRIEKFYNFSFNEVKNETDLFIYGEIISGDNEYKWSETDVTFQDIKDTLESMNDNSTLNMYFNSPGGSVFATSSMLSMLQRAKDRGITINSYLDALCASCASFLPLIADNVYVYENSVMMIHRASSICWGNADDMQQQIDLLNKIEDGVIIPMYMSKAKDGYTEQDFKDMMSKETWLTSKEIQDIFNVTPIQSTKQITACVDRDTMKNFINIPDNIKELLNVKEEEGLEDNTNTNVNDETTPIVENEETTPLNNEEENVTGEENTEATNGEEKEEENKVEETENTDDSKVEDELKASNEKVIALNEKVQNLTNKLEAMQPIVDEYNAKIKAEKEAEKEAKIKETTDLYKNKFENLGAIDKFNSAEIQDLLANSYENDKNIDKLNSMIVALINIDETMKNKIVKKNVSETGIEINDLIPNENDGLSSYFE